MYPKTESWKELPKGTIERAVARIAQIANCNTIMGGCSAMRMADRAERMGLPNAGELQDAVSATYSASTGSPSPAHRAWSCGECGCVHLGREAAEECCGECEYED